MGAVHTPNLKREKNHFLISLMLGPISMLVVPYMCFINNSFMLRFISKLVVGSGLIHFSSPIWKFFDLSPHFISSSLLDSTAAVFIQFVQVGHLLSFFHFCPYFLSFCPIFSTFVPPISFLIVPDFLSRNIFFHRPGMHNFLWVDQESYSLSLLLVNHGWGH